MTDECRTLCLGDVADIVMGQSPPGETVSAEPCGLPLLNGPTEFGQHHPSPVQFTTGVRKRAMRGDILFCVRGSTTGRMNWADQEYAIGRGLAAIRHKRVPELQPFVRAVVEYYLPDLLAQATGSTFPNVTVEQLARIPYPRLPELEQRAIAHILGTLDDKIESNRRMSETLEAMARAIFKAWFVDFEPVRAKVEGRWRRGESIPGMPAHLYDLFSDRLVDSELGKIPEGWSAGTFGQFITQRTERVGDREVVVLSAVACGKLVRSDEHFTKRVYSKEIRNYLLVEQWDVAYNPSRINIGSIGMLEEPIVGAVSPVYVVARPEAEYRWFLEFSLRRACTREWINTLASGSVRQSLSYKDFASIPCVIPPRHVAMHFTRVWSQLRKGINSRTNENTVLITLRDTLLPKLISGELRVKNAQRFIGRTV
ncbi:MAG: restriction endonuclease subunit S [Bacteroidota bacterium]